MVEQKLTAAEKLNVSLLAQDNGIKQVANIRGVSQNTVKAQVNSAKLKMGAYTVQGLTAKCIKAGLLILFLAMSFYFTRRDSDHIIAEAKITNIDYKYILTLTGNDTIRNKRSSQRNTSSIRQVRHSDCTGRSNKAMWIKKPCSEID